MAEYSFWVIPKEYVTITGDSGSERSLSWWAHYQAQGIEQSTKFVVTDTSKFVKITVRDDDINLDLNGGGSTGPRMSTDYDSSQQVLAEQLEDSPAGYKVTSLNYREITDAEPGAKITTVSVFLDYGTSAPGNDSYYSFTNISPDSIVEGKEYSLGGPYSDNFDAPVSSTAPPPFSYSDLYQVTCFTSNTLIETDHGNKPVEDLRPGDMIATMDNGYQPIRWIGSTARDAVDLAHHPKLKPVRIPAGALGGGLPKRDLTVSRQHRVLVRSKIAQRMFGAEEILIPAIKLVGLAGIEIVEDCDSVTYFHILFDKHQVIFSEDAPTESLFTGPVALQSVSPEARKEIEILFPEITEPDFVAQSVRPIPAKGAQIKQLVERHKKRDMPLLNN